MAVLVNATPFTWVGYAAGSLTTICFVPQVLHVWTNQARRRPAHRRPW